MTEKFSSTWMLFASGASVKVHSNSYEAPSGSKRPVDAYVVSDCDGDCEEAAARAVETVWQAVSVQGKRLKPLVFGFDLPGKAAKMQVVGASGGLAFVVSAMQKFTGCDFGPVAATGILPSTDLEAPLLQVKSIEDKLLAAFQLIPAGGLVLYPEANEHQVSDTLRTQFKDKQIRLESVRNVSKTLELLMDHMPENSTTVRRLPRWPLYTACGIFLILLVAAGVAYQKKKEVEKLPVVSFPEPVASSVEPSDPVKPVSQKAEMSEDERQVSVESPTADEVSDGEPPAGKSDSVQHVAEEQTAPPTNSQETSPNSQNETPLLPPAAPVQPSQGFD